MVSSTPGLIAQMAGFLTKKRYKYACVFVDHQSDFSYVHLMQSQSTDEAIAAKQAFEVYAESHGVEVKHYHADNGIFAAGGWREHCANRHQSLSFAGVNSHHQNGRCERRIRSLQEQARCTLIHAHHRWPTAVTAHLWPYAVRYANDSLNNTPCERLQFKMTPLQEFARSKIDANPIHWHPLFCPVYILSRALQTGSPHNKWRERSTPGVYLGRSPIHARSVALVLNLKTGRVSPQFHIKMDPTFSTVSGMDGNNPPQSYWQAQCGFIKGKRSLPAEETHSAEPEFIEPSDGNQIDEPTVDETFNVVDDEGQVDQPEGNEVNLVTPDVTTVPEGEAVAPEGG